MVNKKLILTVVNLEKGSNNILIEVNKSRSILNTAAILYATMVSSDWFVFSNFEEIFEITNEIYNKLYNDDEEDVFLYGENIFPVPLGYDCNNTLIIASSYIGMSSNIIQFKNTINSNVKSLTRMFGDELGDMKNENDFTIRIPYISKDDSNKQPLIEMLAIDENFYYSEKLATLSIKLNLLKLGVYITNDNKTALEIIEKIKCTNLSDSLNEECDIEVELINGDTTTIKFGFKENSKLNNVFVENNS